MIIRFGLGHGGATVSGSGSRAPSRADGGGRSLCGGSGVAEESAPSLKGGHGHCVLVWSKIKSWNLA